MDFEYIFNCRKCGDCCKGYGGTFVTDSDIEAICRHLKFDPEKFIETYCSMSGAKPLLIQGKNDYCIFWDKVCTIHPVKPAMCKSWPFIQSVLTDVDNWYIMASFCPGMRTDVPDRLIKEYVKNQLLIYEGESKKT